MKTSVIETISNINRDSGISNNMMVHRLALLIEQQPLQLQSTTVLDNSERSRVQEDLRTALIQNAQTTENYRQALLNKYYAEYLIKFGTRQTEATSNNSRIEDLITQRKQTFLQNMFDSGERSLPLGQKVNNNLLQATPSNTNTNTAKPEVKQQQDASAKNSKSLIDSVIRTIVTMGKDTNDQGRVYEGVVYRLQLLMKQRMQFVSVHRKTGTPSTAFTAYKQDNQEFQITDNNLSESETSRLIAFEQQQAKQHHQSQNDNSPQTDNRTELGD